MKPVPFEYRRPSTLDEALALAARDDINVRFLAGGQSLGPMLNLRLVQPDLLIDITGLAALKRVEEKRDEIILGALITHADIEDGRVPDPARGFLTAVATNIAYRAVRNRGTIGGSLAHADPAADWLSALTALGASIRVRGVSGARSIAIEDFVRGIFETALAPGEMIEAIAIPRLSEKARWGIYKVTRKVGEFAHAIGIVVDDPARAHRRAVFGATEGKPIVIHESVFGGDPSKPMIDRDVARAALVAEGLTDPIDQQIRMAALQRAAKQAAGS